METDALNLAELLQIMRRKLVLILCCTVGFGAAALIYTIFFITPQYQSFATLIVNNQNTASNSTSITNDQINSAKQLVDTYAVILKSDTVMDTVISRLNLRSREGFSTVTTAQLASMVSITQVDSTPVMRIAATTPNATLSTEIVSEIVDVAPELIIQTVKAGSVEVITSPRAKDGRVSPSNKKNTLLGAVIGFVLAVLFAILLSKLDQTVKTGDDIVKNFNLPVLGIIPSYEE